MPRGEGEGEGELALAFSPAGRRIYEPERQRPAGNATAVELGPAACLPAACVPACWSEAMRSIPMPARSRPIKRGVGSAVFTRRAPGRAFAFVPAQKRRGLAQRSVGSDAIRLIIPLPNECR